MILGLCALAVETMALGWGSGATFTTMIFLLIAPTYFFIFVCLLDLLILLLRCLIPRWQRLRGEPGQTQSESVTKPPNDTMNPAAGGRRSPLSRVALPPERVVGER